MLMEISPGRTGEKFPARLTAARRQSRTFYRSDAKQIGSHLTLNCFHTDRMLKQTSSHSDCSVQTPQWGGQLTLEGGGGGGGGGGPPPLRPRAPHHLGDSEHVVLKNAAIFL